MKEQEIYQKIGELLWSIMPEEAVRIDFIGSIYPEHYSGGAEWVVANGDIHYFPLGQRPDSFEISYAVDGRVLPKEFIKNTPAGN